MPDNSIGTIEELRAETLRIPIRGTAPLIMHAWSEKAKRMMLDGFQGKRKLKEPKNPEQEYEAAFYRMDDGRYGFPALAFKAAAVEAAGFYGRDVTKVGLRRQLFFTGDYSKTANQQLVPIMGDPAMREDTVRLSGRGGSTASLVYRPEFLEWTTELTVTFVKTVIARDSVLSVIGAGGLGVGVGEWRPEKSGNFGTYEIDQTREIEVLG